VQGDGGPTCLTRPLLRATSSWHCSRRRPLQGFSRVRVRGSEDATCGRCRATAARRAWRARFCAP